jgi:hypothetical protein
MSYAPSRRAALMCDVRFLRIDLPGRFVGEMGRGGVAAKTGWYRGNRGLLAGITKHGERAGNHGGIASLPTPSRHQLNAFYATRNDWKIFLSNRRTC